MAAKKRAVKKTRARKKAPPKGYLWFDKDFIEGPGPDPIGKKRKAIVEFYKGYLLAYNDNPSNTKNFNYADDEWAVIKKLVNGTVRIVQHLKFYIQPAPQSQPGGGTTDPPTPTGPPPPNMS